MFDAKRSNLALRLGVNRIELLQHDCTSRSKHAAWLQIASSTIDTIQIQHPDLATLVAN